MGPSDKLLGECIRLLKPSGGKEEGEELSWENKPLHSTYHRQIEEVADIEKSYQWLEKAGLKDSIEALIMAAQEQTVSTRAVEVYYIKQDPRCRLCKEVSETAQHLVAGCKIQAGMAYMERHN